MDFHRILHRISDLPLPKSFEKILVRAKTRAVDVMRKKSAFVPTPGRPLRFYSHKGYQDFSTEEAVSLQLNRFQGWHCGAGVESLYIRGDGEVFRGSCRVGESMGNIYQSRFEFPAEWVVCPRNFCRCGADMFTPKAKDKPSKVHLALHYGKNTKSAAAFDVERDRVAVERTHAAGKKQVHWEVGYRCNYACSYCSHELHNKTDPIYKADVLISAAEKVFREFARGKTVNFIISGGEPSLHPGLLDLLAYVDGQGHKVSLHSNGSRRPQYYLEALAHADLNLSVHFESCKDAHILEIAKQALQFKKSSLKCGHFELKLMTNVQDHDRTVELLREVCKLEDFFSYCGLSVVPIQPVETGPAYVENYDPETRALFGFWNDERLKNQPFQISQKDR